MNKFREKIEPDDVQLQTGDEEMYIKKQETTVDEVSSGFLKRIFTNGVVSKEDATTLLPFILFVAFLTMVYIANSHMAVNNIRAIDKLNKEVKELSYDYKSLKAELMFKSKLTEVQKIVDTLGIKELIEPPKKIIVSESEY